MLLNKPKLNPITDNLTTKVIPLSYLNSHLIDPSTPRTDSILHERERERDIKLDKYTTISQDMDCESKLDPK